MRQILLAALLIAAFTVPTATATADGQVGVRYEWGWREGLFTVVDAPGQELIILNGHWEPIFHAIVHEPYMEYMVPHMGPGPDGVILRGSVGGAEFNIIEPDWEWI